MTATMQPWPAMANGGSWTLPRHTPTTQGSQTRSWSQSSQGGRHEALGCRSPNGQMMRKMPERDSRSPRTQKRTFDAQPQRAPSFTHLQGAVSTGAPAHGSPQTNGSAKAPPAAQPDVQDEAHMNNLRQSLLQHIQSVQQEIARLQLERQRAQQGFSEARTQPEQVDSASAPPKSMVYAASPPSITGNMVTQKGSASAAAMATPLQARHAQPAGPQQPPLCSPHVSTRGFDGSSEATAKQQQQQQQQQQQRLRDRSSSERATERWRKPGPRREPRTTKSLQGSLLAPAAPVKQAASMTVPVLNGGSVTMSSPLRGGSVTMSSPLRGPARTSSPSRLDGPKRGASPQHRLASAKLPGSRVSKHAPSPARNSSARNSMGSARLNNGREHAPVRSVRTEAFTMAALRIQRFWRQRQAKASRRRGRGGARSSSRRADPKRRRFAPVHCAAARIQRSWKLYQWRRKFVDYSVRENGWLGSLEWLQRHNLLYGTELADHEDVQWWIQQRASAQLDSEVDPWGSERLLEHLNRMWYGSKGAEVMQQQQEQKRRLAERQEQERLQQELSRDQRSEDIFSSFAAVGANGHWSNGRTIMVSGGRAPSPGCVASSLQALPSAERSPGVRQVSVASVPGNPMSPRTMGVAGSAWTANGSTPTAGLGPESRHKGAALGAPPPSTQGFSRTYRVASHSPPQTHRTARATVPATPSSALSSLRARSPVQTISGTTPSSTRLSLPASSSMQTRSLGTVQRHISSMNRAMSGSPPPSSLSLSCRSPVASRR